MGDEKQHQGIHCEQTERKHPRGCGGWGGYHIKTFILGRVSGPQGSVQKEVIVGGVLQKWDGIDFTARRVSVRREISIPMTPEGKWYK